MKAIVIFFSDLLTDFKWYRRKVGGTWYHIREVELNGMAATVYWSQVKPESELDKVIETEEYK